MAYPYLVSAIIDADLDLIDESRVLVHLDSQTTGAEIDEIDLMVASAFALGFEVIADSSLSALEYARERLAADGRVARHVSALAARYDVPDPVLPTGEPCLSGMMTDISSIVVLMTGDPLEVFAAEMLLRELHADEE